MRLQASEDDVYRLMDRKERYFWGALACSAAEGISVYFLVCRKQCWDLAYLCAALAVWIALFLRKAAAAGKRVMEAESCYMELDGDSLAVCQPEKNGHYEACRIFYQEIDKIVEGSRRGIPEFYVTLRKPAQEQESFILLDGEEQERHIFCVRSFGFDNQRFREFYRELRWRVPGKVRIIGTKRQEIWEMRKTNTGICLAVAMALGYAVPKFLQAMGYC